MPFSAYYKTQIATGKRKEIIEMLLGVLPDKDNDAFNLVVSLAQQWHDLQEQIRAGIIDDDDSRISSNKITHALLQLLDSLDDAGHLPPPPVDVRGDGSPVVPQRIEGATYQINQTAFKIVYDDLTNIEADAYVSSDSTQLGMEGGVSMAIRQKAGDVYFEETRKHIPLGIGEIAVTSAGNLPGKYVFHFASMNKEEQLFPDVDILSHSTETLLQLSEMLRVDSLVMPALGTGKAKLPFQDAATAITKVIGKYLQGETRLKTLTIALFAREGVVTRSDLNAFYESAVGGAAILAQNSALTAKLQEMRALAEAEGLTNVLSELDAMQQKLTDGKKQLESKDSMSTLGTELMNFGMSNAMQQSGSTAVSKSALEAQLSGLYSALNIKRSMLRSLEDQLSALPDPFDAPAQLEMSIEMLRTETNEIQQTIRKLKGNG